MYDYSYTTTTSADPNAVAGLAVFSGVWLIFWVIFALLVVAAMWKIYTKASQPGWAAIVPFYNIYVLLQVVGKPGWWLVLYFIPFANLVVSIIVALELAKKFGKSSAYGFFLNFLFMPIGQLMLGFGSAKYKK